MRKWRPGIRLVLGAVLVSVLALPLASLFFFRIYENHLVRQTESELIAEAAVLASVFRAETEAMGVENFTLGTHVTSPSQNADEPYQPILPSLDLASDSLLGSRPAARHGTALSPAYMALGAKLKPLLLETQRVTLSGFRLLDAHGMVIAGKEEEGQSLAHIEEVAAALNGTFRSVMRLRVSKHEPPPLYSLSRGTGVRIFAAMPVVVRDQVAGVVYVSRTPSNVFKHLYEERSKVILAGALMMVLTGFVGFVFYRLITRPILELMSMAEAIGKGRGKGEGKPPASLRHYGTSEFAALSDSFLDMAARLQNHSRFVSTFAAHVTHALKSPLTSIQGAAELLRDEAMAPGSMSLQQQKMFLDNIIVDTKSLAEIVARLRELARSETMSDAARTNLLAIMPDLRSDFPALNMIAEGDMDQDMAMSAENLKIVLAHLADNSLKHDATQIEIRAARHGTHIQVTVCDNGRGISENNRLRVFEPFFTTQQPQGGTGMGLPIVRSLLEAHGGSIALLSTAGGAGFSLEIPLAQSGQG